MTRGGRRSGAPGTAYSNRSDLNTGQVSSNPTYGDGAAQQRALQAVPLPSGQQAATAPAAPSTPPPGPPPGYGPGELPDLLRPTERPGVPLTGGAPAPSSPGDEAQLLQQHVPYLEAAINDPTIAPSVVNLLRWIKSQAPV